MDSPQTTKAGTILHFTAATENSDHLFALDIQAVDRFNACYRTGSCWMDVKVGSDPADMPIETQFLLLKSGSDYTVYVPLLDGPFRAMLQPMAGGIGRTSPGWLPPSAMPSTRAMTIKYNLCPWMR